VRASWRGSSSPQWYMYFR